MANIKVVFWSGTGNTQAMAEAVANGIKSAGASAELLQFSELTADTLASEDKFALGCPAMGFLYRARRQAQRQKGCPFRFLRLGKRRMDGFMG